VKIAFDENIPPEMVRIFRQDAETYLALGHQVISARDYRPEGERGDENWIKRFASDGGQVIISGDVRMRVLAHERAALAEGGLITYFFQAEWNNMKFHTKVAMLVKWWPQIAEHMTSAELGTCWEIPFTWGGGEFRDVSARSAEIVRDRPKRKKRRPRKRKGKKARDAKKEKP
jgi:hypothetical protein